MEIRVINSFEKQTEIHAKVCVDITLGDKTSVFIGIRIISQNNISMPIASNAQINLYNINEDILEQIILDSDYIKNNQDTLVANPKIIFDKYIIRTTREYNDIYDFNKELRSYLG